MSERFDRVLDECMDRVILHGETVEACLARYPEFAVELEKALQLAAGATSAFATSATAAGKERGRRRLQAEAAALRQRDEIRSRKAPVWRFPRLEWRAPRWAVAVAVIVIMVAAGGPLTVAASAGALPGDELYPVKRAVEGARLSLETSDRGKAALHLSYAERRALEMGSLLERGDTTHLETALSALQDSLSSATRIVINLRDQDAVDFLASRMSAGASEGLSILEAAVERSPVTAIEPGGGLLRAAGAAYGETVEAMAARARRRPAVAGRGILEVRAVSPPPEGVERLLVEVGEIAAHLATGEKKGWVTLTREPQTFDLAQMGAVQRLLGELEVEPGTYTKVRLTIEGATVVVGGVEHRVTVPGQRLELVRPFRVEEGKRTVVVVDFDGAASPRVTGRGEYFMTPAVTVLAREPDRDERERARAEKDRRAGRGPAAGERKGAPGAGAARTRVEVQGVLEAVAPDSVTVRGRRILITAGTQVEGVLETGRKVRLEAVLQPDGSIEAAKIQVQERERVREKPAPQRPAQDGERPPEQRKPGQADRANGRDATK